MLNYRNIRRRNNIGETILTTLRVVTVTMCDCREFCIATSSRNILQRFLRRDLFFRTILSEWFRRTVEGSGRQWPPTKWRARIELLGHLSLVLLDPRRKSGEIVSTRLFFYWILYYTVCVYVPLDTALQNSTKRVKFLLQRNRFNWISF